MTAEKRGKQLELLAPAGSYETFQAVIAAGADAVYMGGSRFGARAYAQNFGEEELLCAIEYAHIKGRRTYLTVNTLLKEDELEKELYQYLLPYYRQGLDAVIVQDLGVISFIRREFPDLPVHTSTQMTVTGSYGAAFMKSLGASRVVTAREMSLGEIRKIHDNVGIEIESFVHGALCYCYSGQCLLSSMLGGRSGNRGRCAQPCRLPYEVYDENYEKLPASGGFVLSPKDLCTIGNIPKFAENGVYSFKIEGRMKKAEYAAGVVSVYRSYIDRYLDVFRQKREQGMSEAEAYRAAGEQYAVSDRDRKRLLELGNRSGFTDGYYFRHNGRDMITFKKPGHEKANETLQREIREAYVKPAGERKEKIKGILRLKKDFPAIIELIYGEDRLECRGAVAQQAQKQPLTKEKVEACMKMTGNTPFEFEELRIEMEQDVFLPVQELKQLRREALLQLGENQAEKWRREVPKERMTETVPEDAGAGGDIQPVLIVSVEDRTQLPAVLGFSFVDAVYLDSSAYPGEKLSGYLGKDVKAVHAAGKQAFFILPSVFRSHTAKRYEKMAEELMEMQLDGIVARSYDAAAFVRKIFPPDLALVLDHNLYTWNKEARRQMKTGFHPLRDTAPLELNRRALLARGNEDSEIVIYGNLPLMISAQCLHKNIKSCDRQPGTHYLKDRYGKYFPVRNNCAECYNTVYNSTPLLLFGFLSDFREMGFAGYRISFTTEAPGEVCSILKLYEDVCRTGTGILKERLQNGAYTNGHYKRGAE